MKVTRFLLFVLTIATLLLSACGGTVAASNPGAGKVEPIPVAFVGTVESMAGDQWVINGQTVTVSADVVRDGPFGIGDQVKVEGTVNTDGSFSVSRVENATPQDASTLPLFGSNSNDANFNDVNMNDANANFNEDTSNTNINDNSNDALTNDANSNANINDDNGNDDHSDNGNASDDHGGNSNSDDDNSHAGGEDGNTGHNGNGGDDNSGGGGNGNDDNGTDG